MLRSKSSFQCLFLTTSGLNILKLSWFFMFYQMISVTSYLYSVNDVGLVNDVH